MDYYNEIKEQLLLMSIPKCTKMGIYSCTKMGIYQCSILI